MCGCLSHIPTGDLAHNPGMCPDWEMNWRSFGSQSDTQSTKPHQAGQHVFTIILSSYRLVPLPEKTLCVRLLILSSLQPLANTDPFSASIVLPFAECHIVVIICAYLFRLISFI